MYFFPPPHSHTQASESQQTFFKATWTIQCIWAHELGHLKTFSAYKLRADKSSRWNPMREVLCFFNEVWAISGLRWLLLLRKTHLGELSFFNKLRWKREGARHTARFMDVIWFSSTKLTTSLRKHRSVCRTSLLSSASNRMAACTAWSHCSLGTSVEKWVPAHQRNSHRKSQGKMSKLRLPNVKTHSETSS